MKQSNTLSQIMEEIGFGRFHFWLFAVCGTAWMQDMIGVINMSILITEPGSSFQVTNQQKTFFVPLYMLGMGFGSSLGGYFSDKYGRIWVFKKSALLTAIGSILLLFSFEPISLIIGIFIFGLGSGAEVTIGGVVFQEFCPPSKKWVLFLFSANWCIGGALAALVAIFYQQIYFPFKLWKGCIGVNIAFCLIAFLLRLKFHQTPEYLYSKYKLQKTEKSLKWVSKWNKKEVDFILVDFSFNQKQKGNLSEPLLQSKGKVSVWKIWKGENLKSTLIFSIVFFSFNFGSCFLYFYMPELLDQSGVKGTWIYFIVFLQNVSGVFGVFLCCKLIQGPLGRKYTIIIPVALQVVCVFIFLVTRDFYFLMTSTTLSQLLGYVAWSGIYTVNPESYKTNVKNFAVGWSNACSKIGGILGPLIGGLVLELEAGFYISIVIASTMMLITATSSIFIKETRGITFS